jgi:hypothetical protein
VAVVQGPPYIHRSSKQLDRVCFPEEYTTSAAAEVAAVLVVHQTAELVVQAVAVLAEVMVAV